MKPVQPKVTWKTVAVVSSDPHAFAQALQSALQELTDLGFGVVSQALRADGSVVLTGQKTEGFAEGPFFPVPQPVPQGPPPVMSARSRRIPDPAPRELGLRTHEVLYHYREGGVQKQKTFVCLVDALRTARDDLKSDAVLPLTIVMVAMTRFEPRSWPLLFKSLKDELDADKPLE